jgi:hypothetical protein
MRSVIMSKYSNLDAGRSLDRKPGFYEGDFEIKKVVIHKCPMCHLFFDTPEEVKEHYAKEIAWQDLHRKTVRGTKIKKIEDDSFVIYTVTSIHWETSSACGGQMGINIAEWNDRYKSAFLNSYVPATPAEVEEYTERRRLEITSKAEADLVKLG